MKMSFKIKIVLSVVVVVFIIIIIILGTRWKVLGNMSDIVKSVQSSSSDFSFVGHKGDRIKISLRTTVESGKVDFILSDSDGNIVEILDRAKALETFVSLNYDDTYTLTARYEGFIGKFSAKISIRRF